MTFFIRCGILILLLSLSVSPVSETLPMKRFAVKGNKVMHKRNHLLLKYNGQYYDEFPDSPTENQKLLSYCSRESQANYSTNMNLNKHYHIAKEKFN